MVKHFSDSNEFVKITQKLINCLDEGCQLIYQIYSSVEGEDLREYPIQLLNVSTFFRQIDNQSKLSRNSLKSVR